MKRMPAYPVGQVHQRRVLLRREALGTAFRDELVIPLPGLDRQPLVDLLGERCFLARQAACPLPTVDVLLERA